MGLFMFETLPTHSSVCPFIRPLWLPGLVAGSPSASYSLEPITELQLDAGL